MGLSLVEEVYFQAWGKAGGSGRVRRAFSLFGYHASDARVSDQDTSKPGLSDERSCAGEAAKRMYFSDAGSTALARSARRSESCGGARFPGNHRAYRRNPESKLGVKFHLTGGDRWLRIYGDPRSPRISIS